VAQRNCDTVDPRVRRTRQLLQQALDTLLKNKELDEISVQDIADEATINRATFYDHFNDKFQLLNSMVSCRFHQLLSDREVHFEGKCAGEMRTIVLAVCDYVAQRRSMEPHMESAIIMAVREILLEGLKKHPPAIAAPPEMVAASVSWAIYGAAKEWAQLPDHCTSEDVADTVTTLISPILFRP
jgi:AcrR family transcriptional regulator